MFNQFRLDFFISLNKCSMASNNFELASFFKMIESRFESDSSGAQDESLFKELVPELGECFFVFDLKENSIVHFAGVKKMFGYDIDKIDTAFLFNMSHPNDTKLVQAIIKNSMNQIIQLKIPKYTNVFRISSRFRKSDGAYIKVLSENFILQTNKNSQVQSILIKYTNVTFVDDSEMIDWWVDTNFLNKKKIRDSIYGVDKDVFTHREREIILLMFLGTKNKEISHNLSISEHTVATHRKNIFSKAKCSAVKELTLYCKKNGVFQ